MDIGLAIRQARKAKNLLQKDLAKETGITESEISLIERNKKNPQKRNVIKIAKVLDMDATDLLKTANEISKDYHKNKIKDITGQRFGRLTVIERADSDKYGQSKWLCKCDCGDLKIIKTNSLTTGNTKSCGCMAREKRHEIGNRLLKNGVLDEIRDKDRFQGTRISALNEKIFKTNTSGIRGVSWNKINSKWEAYIQIKGKQKHLGLFDKIEDAAKARKEAEEKYFKPIIEEFHEIQGGA